MSTTTEHYELNIAEGTDLVNPLLDTFPNFEKIDEAMWNNKLGGVIVATHLLSGSVHAITLEPQGSTVFRFVATAAYTVGQTFTVNGQQVTGLTTNGSTLSNNAFVVNQNVLCCLVGTNLTFYVNNNVDEAEDSKKLGGQLPAYYATAEQAETAINTAQAANTIAQGAQGTANTALATAVAASELRPNLLWRNSNPTASFSAQNITVDNSEYSWVMIRFYSAGSNQAICQPVFIKTGEHGAMIGSLANYRYRYCDINNGSVSFSSGYLGTSVDNNMCVPIEIYGLKW